MPKFDNDKSLVVKGSLGNYYISLREWYFQGDRPDYTKITGIFDEEVYALLKSKKHSITIWISDEKELITKYENSILS